MYLADPPLVSVYNLYERAISCRNISEMANKAKTSYGMFGFSNKYMYQLIELQKPWKARFRPEHN